MTINLNILFPQHSPYYIRIARFMPRVELVQKHNFSARRLYIRGNNGKVCDVMSACRLVMKLCDKQLILNKRKFVCGSSFQTRDISLLSRKARQMLKQLNFFRSDEGLTLETSALESLYQCTLSTQLIKPNCLVIPHRCSARVSLEIYLFNQFFFRSTHILW